jgi:hypothetical protein
VTVPSQLAGGLWKKRQSRRTEPRPIVETLPRIDIADLCRWNVFPKQTEWHKAYLLELPFRYPFVKNLVISLQEIEVNHHLDYAQTIRLRWCATGFGGKWHPRPLFVCDCGRSVRRVYFRSGHLACRRCWNSIYASRLCSGKQMRSALQAIRLQSVLRFKRYMGKRNRQRIKARIRGGRRVGVALRLPNATLFTAGWDPLGKLAA